MWASKIGSCAAAGVAPSTSATTSAASRLGVMAAMVALTKCAGYSAPTHGSKERRYGQLFPTAGTSRSGRRRRPGGESHDAGLGAGERSDHRRPSARALSAKDGPHPAHVASAAARDADEMVRPRDHAERGVLRALSRLSDPHPRGPGDVAFARRWARGSAARAVDGRAQDEVSGDVRD